MLILSNIFQSIRNSEYSVKKITVRQIRVWPVPFVNLGYFVFNCFWGLECFSDLVLRSAVIFKTYMQPTNWLETNCSFLLNEQARKQQALRPLLWRKANARDTSVNLYGGQVTLTTQLVEPNSLWLVCWNKTILGISKRLTLLAALRLYKSTTLKAETVSGWSGRHMF